MTTTSARRSDSLSRKRIVATAVEILDTEGESALTLRAIANRLSTGAGAIYWHVANKGDVLAAATDEVIGAAVAAVPDRSPRETIRALALGVYDALDAHPWVGTQLAREPWQSALLRLFEGFGSQVDALGVPEAQQFDCATALLNFVLGLAGQHAAAARVVPPDMDRAAVLSAIADRWAQLDAADYPFLRRVAEQMPEHDDRAQFLAGIDLILVGIIA